MKQTQSIKIEYNKDEDITIKLFTRRQMKEYVKLQDKSDASEGFMLELYNMINSYEKKDYNNRGEEILEKLKGFISKYPELSEDL